MYNTLPYIYINISNPLIYEYAYLIIKISNSKKDCANLQ